MKKRILTAVLLVVAAAAVCILVIRFTGSGSGIAIKEQPSDVTVSYPEGATFSVKVDKPWNVASYQWVMEDIEKNVFVLTGSSAKKAKLVVPSTVRLNNALDFYCIITDKQGNETVSEHGQLLMDNRDDIKPVFYVGEYAIEPGETLDLSKIKIGDGYKLGKGTVSFDSNGTDLTITDLDYDNSHTMCGLAVAPNVGLDLEYEPSEDKEYTVTFVGDCRINNEFYDYDYNAAGIPFDFYMIGEGPKPLVNFVGDGTLTITNGYNAIRIIGDLMVDIDINIKQTKKLYGDGIVAQNLMIAEGRKLDLEVYGAALYATGNLFIDGAEINIDAHAPHVSVGAATKNILQAGISINIKDSDVKISASAEQDVCKSVIGYAGISTIGELFITNSDVSFTADVKDGDALYASSFVGIYAGSGSVEDSNISVNVDTRNLFGLYGLYADENFIFTNSTAEFNVKANGLVMGIAPEEDFSSEDSVINVHAGNYTDYGDLGCYGIMCGNAVFKCEKDDSAVKITAENGMAIGCNLNESRTADPAKYTKGYKAAKFFLRDDTVCSVPENYVFNLGNFTEEDNGSMSYIHVETVYDANDTSKPAQEVVFSNQD